MPVVEGITNPKVVQALQYPPSDEVLRQKSLTFVKECKPKSYRQMKRLHELEEYLDLKVKACKREAQSLMESGVWENEAWNRAIRQELLESESD